MRFPYFLVEVNFEMLLLSPWVKKILKSLVPYCSRIAYLDVFTFIMVEKTFEIVTSSMLLNGLFEMLLPWLGNNLKL